MKHTGPGILSMVRKQNQRVQSRMVLVVKFFVFLILNVFALLLTIFHLVQEWRLYMTYVYC